MQLFYTAITTSVFSEQSTRFETEFGRSSYPNACATAGIVVPTFIDKYQVDRSSILAIIRYNIAIQVHKERIAGFNGTKVPILNALVDEIGREVGVLGIAGPLIRELVRKTNV